MEHQMYYNYIQVSVEIFEVLEDGEDYEGEYSVDKINGVLEELHYWDEVKKILDESLENSGWNDDDKNNMEICIIGGTMRIPYLMNHLVGYLEEIGSRYKTLTKTVNMDECVCQGNSYFGAITKHINACRKCSDRLHYNIIDHTNFHRKTANVEIDIEKIKKMINILEENNEKEINKSKIINNIEKMKYDYDREKKDFNYDIEIDKFFEEVCII